MKEKKIAIVRSSPVVDSYEIYRIDKVFAPSTTNPQNTPSEPPYQFVAKMEITNLEDFAKAMQSPEIKEFVEEYSAFIDPSSVFTMGHKIEP